MAEETRSQPIHAEPGIATGELASTCIVLWRSSVTQERFTLQRDALLRVCRQYPGRACFLCVIEPSAKPPDEALRRASVAMLAELRNELRAVSVVIEGNGFEAAITRSVLAGMMLILRSFPRENIVFCASVKEGATELARRAPWVDAAELTRTTEAIRSRIPR